MYDDKICDSLGFRLSLKIHTIKIKLTWQIISYNNRCTDNVINKSIMGPSN